jgi:predicted MFS family arabinose efflux permease
MVAVGLLGIAAGSASGGTLGAALGARPVLLFAAGVFGVAALWTVVRIHTVPAPAVIAASSGVR